MTAFASDAFPAWQKRIKLLLESAWRDTQINEVKIDRWLRNFQGEKLTTTAEQQLACHLLQQFLYFGSTEVDESMKVLFRDHFIYPALQELRTRHLDTAQLAAALENRILHETRFVAVGKPSESGAGMLYQFRLVNNLPVSVFPNLTEIFQLQGKTFITNPTSLRQLIFFDDLCATGEQVERKMSGTISWIRNVCPHLKLSYFLLFATEKGLENARKAKLPNGAELFNEVIAAVILDEDYKVFSTSSLFYKYLSSGINQQDAMALCNHYGTKLKPSDPLGFQDSQLLIGFAHNTPDNTLPIFWKNDENLPWYAIFPRVEKY